MSASALSLWAHVQTATAAVPFRRALPRDATTSVHDIAIPEGGALVVVAHFLPRPAPLVVVLHGVAGSSDDAYVVRAAHELVRAGFHVVRINQRGTGRGAGRARRLYHAGLAEDLALVEQFVRADAARAAIVTSLGALGFSLGGHVALHRAADSDALRAVVAISAPLDLSTTMSSFARLRGTPFAIYERLMTRSLVEKARALKRAVPDAPFTLDALKRVTTIDAFDDVVTIACSGFASVARYHAQVSVGPRLASIAIPTLLVHAEDDPVCPAHVLRQFPLSSSIELTLLPAGGHVGFVGDLSQLWGASAAVSRAIAFFRQHL